MELVCICPKGHRSSVSSSQSSSDPVCPICGTPSQLASGHEDQNSAGFPDNDSPESSSADTASPGLAATLVYNPAHWPTLPGHRILGQLGRGGMGVVYKALQIRLNRVVAVKMMNAEAQQEGLARFHIEAQAVASLQHPNIVQIYEFGESGGHPYISLEFVDGCTLSDLLSGHPQPPRKAAELMETVARAVHFAHQHSIIHRDLKPSNILITSGGVPKISDFGLAKRLADDSSQTRTGTVIGTPDYMAPEQATGRVSQIGPATDVHALGAILYDMLTGRPPFKGNSVLDTLAQVTTAIPAPIRRVQATVHPDLETICLKCLEKEPRHRYASAAEVADELRRFLNGEPIQARRVPLWQRGVRWAARRPAIAAMAAAIVLVTAAGLVGMLSIWRHAETTTSKLAQETKALEEQAAILASDRVIELDVPFGLPTLSIPSDNALTLAKVELGRELFFDKRLSLDNTLSCAGCHDPEHGWGNGQRFATGVGQQVGNRNAPSIVNTAFYQFQFWDGRAGRLEEQALMPIQNPIEMAITSLPILEQKLNSIPDYRARFLRIFGEPPTANNLAKAIAAFERTLVAGDAPYDRFVAGDASAMSPAAIRGWKLFFNKAHCSACHAGPNFTDNGFHNIGIGMDDAEPDVGRWTVSKLEGDRGSFKTPSLRDVARTAPYMHDGRLATLEDVVSYYNDGGTPNPFLDEEVAPLRLTAEEQADLIAFLREGLSSSKYPVHTPE